MKELLIFIFFSRFVIYYNFIGNKKIKNYNLLIYIYKKINLGNLLLKFIYFLF